MTLRVLSIFGTRPEAVKMAPVLRALADTPEVISRVCVTAQHREMLDQVLRLFGINPDVDLNLMRPNQTLARLTADILTNMEPILLNERPDWVLVQGDTTTVMATSLLCFYHGIHVGHVEAGLRTGDMHQPFPEEMNRRVASVVADLHFAPTEHSRENLLREGIPDWRITVTGNPVIDALQTIANSPMPEETRALLERVGVGQNGKRLILVTAHRRENFGQPLEDICIALRSLAQRYAGQVELIYPVHRNPNVEEPVHALLGGVPGITLLPPLEYLPLVHLMKSASIILTDSGGIQEEATALKIPTLVLRAVTERPEGVQAGGLKLVGTSTERITAEAVRLLDDPLAHQAMAQAENPFGDGHAAARIVRSLLNFCPPSAE